MATLVLSAVGGAIGASVGGAAMGLSSVVLGRALGASVGRAIDSKILGGGSAPVERGRIENFRMLGAREGASIPRVFGSMRLSGQIIWSTNFKETVSQTSGSKGYSGGASDYSYSISLAIALCEGEITRIGKVWADGKEISLEGVDHRLYLGDEAQMPDDVIIAVEGSDKAPAYRGTAYIVFENLDLARFGNRIPQFNFEVIRNPEALPAGQSKDAVEMAQAVALVPGTGEYALATTPVTYPFGKGDSRSANVNGYGGGTDFERSIQRLGQDLPNTESVSLVVSWFGDDLRCNLCTLQPAVDQQDVDGDVMPWSVSGQGRAGAKIVGQIDGRPAFGGTPSDQSVVEAIQHIHSEGKEVMFYPFILMDILEGNGLPDPWSGAFDQPSVPWRGRITTSAAPTEFGSPDKTLAARSEVEVFFGVAGVDDFSANSNSVTYSGLPEWSYRRFILHYAHLCAVAGGVEAFCIGSEMRSLTQIRDGVNSFPAVSELIRLAADVRSILGTDCKISYAADWSEYFGYQPNDGSGDLLYHLDPLWADENIDFIGIDNYMPLSDWRDEPEHADDGYSSIYDLEYLQSNIEGGEGFDWYYANDDARRDQIRSSISDAAHGEDWVYRYKDIRSWWSRQHHERIGGVRNVEGTDWLPGSKPIWFTEIGCPAVDKGTNQPNVFDDSKSSESALPYFSNGNRDDLIQHRYIQAVLSYWGDPANNPDASQYVGKMIETSRAHIWAWDARPYPEFPNRINVWSDGNAYSRGHWVSGRMQMAPLPNVVAEICRRSGLEAIDVSELYGLVNGFVIGSTETARQSLQPLMTVYGFDCFERDGVLVFRNRGRKAELSLDKSRFAADGEISLTRNPDAEMVGRLRVEYLDADNDYQVAAAEYIFPDEEDAGTSENALPLNLRSSEGQAVAERWLAEARVARDEVSFSVAPSEASVGIGDVISVEGVDYRVDRIEEAGARHVHGMRVENGLYVPRPRVEPLRQSKQIAQYGAPYVEFLDVPLLDGTETSHSFHVAASATPWPGRVAVFSANTDYGYELNTTLARCAVVGELVDDLPRAQAGIWQRTDVRVKLASGNLSSLAEYDVLNGGNRAALRNSNGNWEVFQFCNAELIGEREYRLSKLLRGQAGTEFVIPDAWSAGTDFVLLDKAISQISLAASERGFERHYRIGPAHLPYDDASYTHSTFAGQGVGLRPYSPVHLKADVGEDIRLSWIRRTRIEGDVWQGYEVPLGEEREAYFTRIFVNGQVVREAETSSASFQYTAEMQTADGLSGTFDFEVAQLSDRYGVGPFTRRTINV